MEADFSFLAVGVLYKAIWTEITFYDFFAQINFIQKGCS